MQNLEERTGKQPAQVEGAQHIDFFLDTLQHVAVWVEARVLPEDADNG